MTNIKMVVVGNCQARPIARLLTILYQNIEVTATAIVHLLNDTKEMEYDALFSEADYIVTQLVGDNYPCQFVSTSKMKEKYGGKIITIPNLFYRGYNPDLQYIRIPGQGALKGPFGDYHSKIIFDAWKQGEKISQLEEKINSVDYWREEFSDVHQSSLNTLAEREKSLEVQMFEDIRKNLASTRLFYTFNHPSLDLIALLVAKVARIAVLEKVEGRVALPKEPLDRFIAPISTFVAQQLEIEFENTNQQYKGSVRQSDGLFEGIKQYDPREMYESYYELYSESSSLLDQAKFS